MALVTAFVVAGGLGLVGSLVNSQNEEKKRKMELDLIRIQQFKNKQKAKAYQHEIEESAEYLLHPNPQSVIDGSVQYTPSPNPAGASSGLGKAEARQDILRMYTGSSDTGYMGSLNSLKKDEVGPMFQPKSQQVYGNVFNPQLDRYDAPFKMNNIGPVDQENVGPGLAICPETPAAGGFQQFFRIRPDNVGGYKKNSFKGDVIAGKALNDRAGVAGELYKNCLPKEYTQKEYPLMKGRSAATAQTPHFEIIDHPTNRQNTTECSSLNLGGGEYFVSHPTIEGQHTKLSNKPNECADFLLNAGFTYSAPRDGYEDNTYIFKEQFRGEKYPHAGNAGRMNLRSDPESMIGENMIPKDDCNTHHPGNYNTQGIGQEYVDPGKQQSNPFLGLCNPRASNESLSIANNQLKNNISTNPDAVQDTDLIVDQLCGEKEYFLR